MPERHDHGKNLIGIVRIELFAKSFILWMYDVLARHRTFENLSPKPSSVELNAINFRKNARSNGISPQEPSDENKVCAELREDWLC